MSALAARRYSSLPLVAGVALAIGALSGLRPPLALAVCALVGVGLLAFRAPAASLTLLLLATAVVPYGIQNQFGVGGGSRSPGLLASDLLLLLGLAWALTVLPTQRLDRRTFRTAVVVLVFLVIVGLQFLHGLTLGHDLSISGQEARALLGFGTFLIAVPVLAAPRMRRHLFLGLLALAVALGAWGLLQWFGHFSYGAAGDVGVRAGVRLTSAGSGQLQGGEYGFPVAIVVCVSVLLSGRVRSLAVRAALAAAIVLNGISCLVTFERTFWLDAILGVGFVLVRTNGRQRARALVVAPIVILGSILALSVLAPTELTTARQRLLSLGTYASDSSVRYRLVESNFVLDEVRAHPVAGSGLAASIFWGQPWAQVPAKSYTFSHDGYLWLAWKLGIPAAALLVLLLASAALRAPPGDDDLTRAARMGAQGALLGILLATITFPSFSALSITAVMGVLLALAIAPAPRGDAWSPTPD